MQLLPCYCIPATLDVEIEKPCHSVFVRAATLICLYPTRACVSIHLQPFSSAGLCGPKPLGSSQSIYLSTRPLICLTSLS